MQEAELFPLLVGLVDGRNADSGTSGQRAHRRRSIATRECAAVDLCLDQSGDQLIEGNRHVSDLYWLVFELPGSVLVESI